MSVNDLITYLLTPVAQVALIIGLAEVAKKTKIVKNEFVPVLDVVLGLISGVLVTGVLLKYGAGIGAIVGIAEGLSACGLFSGVKNVAEGLKKTDV